jgi:hypothetical protein
VSAATGSGRPGGVRWWGAATGARPAGLPGKPLAELGAPIGHGRPLQGQGLLGGQPTELEAFEVAALPGGDDRTGCCLRVQAEPGPGAGGPGAQFDREVGEKHQLVGCPDEVAGHQLIQDRAIRLRHGRMQQRSRADDQHAGRLGLVGRIEAEAEVAVRHPAQFQDLAVGLRRAAPPVPLPLLVDG